jgi:UDP-4-amino-4,6-dideoxy-N-acetyl-beta-L-altrosamine transaminase
MIPYGRQHISQADIDAVIEVLRSDYLTQGPAVPAFEQAVARYCGSAHAIASNSATSSLHTACLALGVGPGDLVWTSPITFVASANCARYCGADVDFVDIDPTTFNMSVTGLEEKLSRAASRGRLPKVVIPVHFAGEPCDMRSIHALSQRYGFRVIEDAAHAIGARYLDTVVGDCRYSDITVFSFHPVKIITTIEGGLATTNDPTIARSLALLRSHGISRHEPDFGREPDGPWYYEQIVLGFNYRMTDVQAALGLSQLQRLDEWVKTRQALATRYDHRLSALPLTLPFRSCDSLSALHLYPILVPDPSGKQRAEVFDRLRKAGIGVNVHYIPVHLQPDFAKYGFRVGDFPNSEAYYRRTITLPLFSSLSTGDQDKVMNVLEATLS